MAQFNAERRSHILAGLQQQTRHVQTDGQTDRQSDYRVTRLSSNRLRPRLRLHSIVVGCTGHEASWALYRRLGGCMDLHVD